nr:hypothetical protein CFP56_12939 [Quercus suber]
MSPWKLNRHAAKGPNSRFRNAPEHVSLDSTSEVLRVLPANLGYAQWTDLLHTLDFQEVHRILISFPRSTKNFPKAANRLTSSFCTVIATASRSLYCLSHTCKFESDPSLVASCLDGSDVSAFDNITAPPAPKCHPCHEHYVKICPCRRKSGIRPKLPRWHAPVSVGPRPPINDCSKSMRVISMPPTRRSVEIGGLTKRQHVHSANRNSAACVDHRCRWSPQNFPKCMNYDGRILLSRRRQALDTRWSSSLTFALLDTKRSNFGTMWFSASGSTMTVLGADCDRASLRRVTADSCIFRSVTIPWLCINHCDVALEVAELLSLEAVALFDD